LVTGALGLAVSDLENVAFAGYDFVEDRVDEEAEEQPGNETWPATEMPALEPEPGPEIEGLEP